MFKNDEVLLKQSILDKVFKRKLEINYVSRRELIKKSKKWKLKHKWIESITINLKTEKNINILLLKLLKKKKGWKLNLRRK